MLRASHSLHRIRSSNQQKAEAARDRAAVHWNGRFVTAIEPLGAFLRAAEYHQDLFARNSNQGYCLAVALPKVTRIRKSYAQ